MSGTMKLTEMIRNLERERDELGQQLQEAKDNAIVLMARLEQRIHQRDEARAEAQEQARLLGMSAERELALRAENERLKKCCTQRGARMQIMREWMDSQRGIGPPSEWWYFVEERPEARDWFDDDGVPVGGEGE